MLVFLQFPIADLRGFQAGRGGRLTMPEWPPRTGIGLHRFVRAFGHAMDRRRGADQAWTDETSFCSAARGLRFSNLSSSPYTFSPDWKDNAKCAFRRLFFDGQAVARIELGISYDYSEGQRYDDRDILSQVGFEADAEHFELTAGLDPIAALDHAIRLPTWTPSYPEKTQVSPQDLIKQGPALAHLFAYATTPNPGSSGLPVNYEMVIPGNPLCLIECLHSSLQHLPRNFIRIDPEQIGGIELAYGRLSRFGGEIGTWVVAYGSADYKAVRSLRLCLVRLHAEQETLYTIIDKLNSGQLQFNPHTLEGDRLEHYLNHATRVVNRDKWMGIRQSAIREAFVAAETTVKTSHVGLLAERLKGARLQVVRKIENFERTLPNHRVTNIYTEKEVLVDNKVINIGAGAKITAPITIADSIEKSFNQVTHSQRPDEIKSLFETLLREVAAASNRLPVDKTEDLSQDVETLGKELSRETPRRRWYELSLNGIKSAAEAVGEVGEPIIKAVSKLLPLLVSMFP